MDYQSYLRFCKIAEEANQRDEEEDFSRQASTPKSKVHFTQKSALAASPVSASLETTTAITPRKYKKKSVSSYTIEYI